MYKTEYQYSWDMPSDCLVLKNKKFEFANFKRQELPHVIKEHQDILDELGISYREYDEHSFEIWNPEFYEEVTCRLPLYYQSGGVYKFAKMVDKVCITEETFEKALESCDSVRERIVQKRQEEIRQECIEATEKILDGKVAVGYDYWKNGWAYENIELECRENYQYFYVYRGKFCARTGYMAIFDVSKITQNSVVTLYVPEGKEGLFIGKNGLNVKQWAAVLGVKRINVVSS